jgi:hypothetical protein
VRPTRRLDLSLAVPRGTIGGDRTTAPRITDFFSKKGLSLVAGRAALVPVGASPIPAASRAAAAGASAVLLYGSRSALPAGGLGLDESIGVPVVSIPAEAARAALSRIARGQRVAVALGAARSAANTGAGRVAAFSSAGLAFDGRVKPDLVAPGVGLATSDPGVNPDGSPRFVTVNGSSTAAATVAGAAALLAQARPVLGASALAGLLTGTARRIDQEPITLQGAGTVDVGAAAAGELAASPGTLALGRSTGAGWRVKAGLALTNLSSRTLRVTLAVRTENEGAAAVDFTIRPARVVIKPGKSVVLRLRAITASAPSGSATADGVVIGGISGGGSIRIPWAIAFGHADDDLIAHATLSQPEFAPSDTKPALLAVDAGRVETVVGHPEIRPLRRLDVVLWRADGTQVGTLALLRDVLPGRYTFGLTGRGPDGERLPPGDYVLRIVGYPAQPGHPSRKRIRFSLR